MPIFAGFVKNFENIRLKEVDMNFDKKLFHVSCQNFAHYEIVEICSYYIRRILYNIFHKPEGQQNFTQLQYQN